MAKVIVPVGFAYCRTLRLLSQSFKICLPGSTHKSVRGKTKCCFKGLLRGKTCEVFLEDLGVCKSLGHEL